MGANRRVPGLRRSEVAALAGVSVEYYTRIERGAIAGVSPEVLDALARALRLEDDERAYLFDLAHAANPVARPVRSRKPREWTPPRELQWMLDSITGAAVVVRNGRMDVLATNALARAFYSDLYDIPGRSRTSRSTSSSTSEASPSTASGIAPRTRRSGSCGRGRAQSPRQGSPRAHRRAVHPQRRVREAVVVARRAAARRRVQTLPPPCGRRPDAGLRVARPRLRTGPDAHDLYPGAAFRVRRAHAVARELGRDARGGAGSGGADGAAARRSRGASVRARPFVSRALSVVPVFLVSLVSEFGDATSHLRRCARRHAAMILERRASG